ncbi:MAG TPA: V-type ATP synthase subunit F [Caldimonas sp.]|nr:V-type ATP synthase subunit F [Caldimonas sp.]
MTVVAYLGDEVTAAGWRVTGARVRTPAQGEAGAALREALAEAEFVLLSSTVAAAIDTRTLQAAVAATSPLVLVVPDPRGDVPVPDLAARLRAQLGLEA